MESNENQRTKSKMLRVLRYMERIEGMMNIRKGKCPNSMVKGNDANNGDGERVEWFSRTTGYVGANG